MVGNSLLITFKNRGDAYKQWLKTLGKVIYSDDNSKITIDCQGTSHELLLLFLEDNYIRVSTSNESTTSNILFLKNIRKVFRKCHYCVGCKVCEANCKFGNLSFDSEGNVVYKSNLLIDEEEEVLEICDDLVVMDISYKVIKKNNKVIYLTRKEEEEKKFLIKEINKIKKNKEESKLNYLFKEFFMDDVDTFNEKINVLEKEISKDYNVFHHKLYNLLKLSMIKNKLL